MRLESIHRCDWVGSDPIYRTYHDREWGVPVHDDRLLFEFLILEGAQAGLSWITILKKRDAYRAAFAGFDPEAVACYDGACIQSGTGARRSAPRVIRTSQADRKKQEREPGAKPNSLSLPICRGGQRDGGAMEEGGI